MHIIYDCRNRRFVHTAKLGLAVWNVFSVFFGKIFQLVSHYKDGYFLSIPIFIPQKRLYEGLFFVKTQRVVSNLFAFLTKFAFFQFASFNLPASKLPVQVKINTVNSTVYPSRYPTVPEFIGSVS